MQISLAVKFPSSSPTDIWAQLLLRPISPPDPYVANEKVKTLGREILMQMWRKGVYLPSKHQLDTQKTELKAP